MKRTEEYSVDPSGGFSQNAICHVLRRSDRTAMVVQKSHENRKQVFSPALANKDEVAASVTRDWQVRAQERLEWLYAYDATSAEV